MLDGWVFVTFLSVPLLTGVFAFALGAAGAGWAVTGFPVVCGAGAASSGVVTCFFSTPGASPLPA